MNIARTSAVLGTVGLLCVFGGAARANVVVNGGFETGDFTGWTLAADATDVVSSCCHYLPHSGSYFAALGDTSPSYPYGTLSQTIADTVGQKLVLSYWLASNGTTPSYFDATWDGATLAGSMITNLPVQSYTEYTFTVTGTGSDLLLFHEQDVLSYLALDDVSLTDPSVPEPFRLAVFGSGLVGLGVARCKRHSLRDRG